MASEVKAFDSLVSYRIGVVTSVTAKQFKVKFGNLAEYSYNLEGNKPRGSAPEIVELSESVRRANGVAKRIRALCQIKTTDFPHDVDLDALSAAYDAVMALLVKR